MRLSGSVIETLFSQYKHTSGGKLSAANYSRARAAHLVEHCVSCHDWSKGYRDVPLQLSECVLGRKMYGSGSKTKSL